MNQEPQLRRVAILGSTGSIGVQALEVIEEQKELLQAEVLTAGGNVDLLIIQARKFVPNVVVIADENHYEKLKSALADLPIKVYTGSKAIEQVVQMDTVDIVLTAMVGYAGLLPTVAAINAGKPIALANKETLVVAGELISKLAIEKQVPIIPVDSEHSAIYQCLEGEYHNPIEKLILTASGGPFRGKKRADLKHTTKAQALKHPNWSMGAKITIDSATLMNKGLEVIEAKWLFNVAPEEIEVVVHPQSIVHSAAQFQDGSIKAQLGLPDMKLPIQYALCYPLRKPNTFPRFSFFNYPQLSFEQPDMETFRCLALAKEALKAAGNVPCVLNAANEIAVAAFLNDRIKFLQIAEVIESTINSIGYTAVSELDGYVHFNTLARNKATEIVAGLG